MKRRQTYPAKTPQGESSLTTSLQQKAVLWWNLLNVKHGTFQCFWVNVLKPFSSNFVIFLYIFNALQTKTKIAAWQLWRHLQADLERHDWDIFLHSPEQKCFGSSCYSDYVELFLRRPGFWYIQISWWGAKAFDNSIGTWLQCVFLSLSG